MKTCSLCQRSGDDQYFEEHHLFPGVKRRKGRNEAVIITCRSCGDQIHLMFTNTELRNEYQSAEALRDAMQTYIEWIRKKNLCEGITIATKKRKR